MDGIPLRLHFPGADLEEVQNTFNPQKEVSSILEFAVNKFPDKVLPTSHIFVLNDQKYDLISPNVLISSLNFRPQQQVLIIPEIYKITIADPKKKVYTMDIRTSFKVIELLQYVCVQSQLRDPRFYQMVSNQTGQKGLALDPDETFTSQAPYVFSFSVEELSPKSVNSILVEDFLNNRFPWTMKDATYIIGSLIHIKLGPYKSSIQRAEIEREARPFFPLSIISKGSENIDVIKNLTKNSVDIYKKLKIQDPIPTLNDYIMALPHFSSINCNGERFSTPLGSKRANHEKVQVSLLFSSILLYKLGTSTVLETYYLSNLQKVRYEGNTSFSYEYDIPQKGGIHQIQITLDPADGEAIITALKERLKVPSATRRSGDKGSSDDSRDITIPSFAAQFTLYSHS